MLRSITHVPCECSACDWDGLTRDCDPDDEGDLCCPLCSKRVVIEYTEHERHPGGLQ